MLVSGAGKSFGGIAQLVERLVRNEKARGSNPLTSSLHMHRRRERRLSRWRYWLSRAANTGPAPAEGTVGVCGSCLNRFVAQISVRRTKKYANMTGQSTSRVMSRP